jgi:transcriptional repressor NrdR
VRCPYCGSTEDKVVDSRPSEDETVIRRRRSCLGCGRRFNTFERVEEVPIVVVKRSGTREPFERAKLVAGLEKAYKNRPGAHEEIERIAAEVEDTLRARGLREVESQAIGVELLHALRDRDVVAYMRFASVYKNFQDPGDFERELESLRPLRKATPPKRTGPGARLSR